MHCTVIILLGSKNSKNLLSCQQSRVKRGNALHTSALHSDHIAWVNVLHCVVVLVQQLPPPQRLIVFHVFDSCSNAKWLPSNAITKGNVTKAAGLFFEVDGGGGLHDK